MEPAVTAALLTSTLGIVGTGLKWAKEARDNSEKALRVLKGEDGIDDKGIVHHVREHREALQAADLYPPEHADRDEDREAVDA